jgi:hypothetical protein
LSPFEISADHQQSVRFWLPPHHHHKCLRQACLMADCSQLSFAVCEFKNRIYWFCQSEQSGERWHRFRLNLVSFNCLP